ncbi:MAG: hypothetical protein WCG78_06680 [Candidatus Omnitrophota bacterium]
MKRFLLYLFRWQLSTPILWLVMHKMGAGIGATILANLIGGAIFFWIDRFIFTSKAVEMWHLKESGVCDGCGKKTRLWRLVLAPNYDRRESVPRFLCAECSRKKSEELKKKGIEVRSFNG